jgi:hypothetical protein
MSRPPAIITPAFIRRHNCRCLGRIALAASGAGAVFFVLFVLGWLLASFVTGRKELDGVALAFASLFSLGSFGLGCRWLQKEGPQDWERLARKSDRQAGMRLSRLSNQDYGQMGRGFLGLVLAGPEWLARIREAYRGLMPVTPEFADRLETLRKHFAAREAWVPMRDFPKYESDLYILAQLNIVAIREMLGEWHFHVTLEGSVKRDANSAPGSKSRRGAD